MWETSAAKEVPTAPAPGAHAAKGPSRERNTSSTPRAPISCRPNETCIVCHSQGASPRKEIPIEGSLLRTVAGGFFPRRIIEP